MGIDAQMFVRHQGKFSPLAVRKMAADAHAALGGILLVSRPGEIYPKGRHCLEIITKYQQDGPDIFPNPGEQFIEVRLYARYYGDGYERGPWPDLYVVYRWLKAQIPDCSIWYGGDSSGVLAKEMTEAFCDKTWGHFCGVGHSPYIEHDNPYIEHKLHPHCEFCGGRRMWNQMMSRDGDGFTCEGCGYMVRAEKDDPTKFYECVRGKDGFGWERKPVKARTR